MNYTEVSILTIILVSFVIYDYLISKKHLIFIEIPEALDPFERVDKYEEPICEELEKHNLGEITGGGTLMREEEGIVCCDILVEVKNLRKSLKVIKSILKKQGAPASTILKYGDGKKEILGSEKLV